MTEATGDVQTLRPDWRAGMAEVARPGLLVWAVGVSVAAGLLAVFALFHLNSVLPTYPRTVHLRAAELGRALELADWAPSAGPGPALYVISFPTCPNCEAFKRTQVPRLSAAGVNIRAIEFAPRRSDGASGAEEAKAAEVSRSRSFESFMAPYDAYPASTAGDVYYVERGRATVDAVTKILKANRASIGFPALFWRQGAGGNARWRFVFNGSGPAIDNVLAELPVRSSSVPAAS